MLQILDEATSALDATTESAVTQTLDDIISRRNLIVVVIAHRLATVMNCDNIVVMDKGQVVEVGSHDQLLRRQGLYHSLVAQQSLGSSNLGADTDDADENGFPDGNEDVST
jgi:ABC-type multidrug transport system fused ATPase/permease subunit